MLAAALEHRRDSGRLSIAADLDAVESPKGTEHKVLFLVTKRPLGPADRSELRPGTCVELIPSNYSSNSNLLLGNIVPFLRGRPHRREEEANDTEEERSLSVMIYQGLPATTKSYTVRPLVSMVNMVRQFGACTRTVKVEFWPSLLGMKGAVHIRFSGVKEEETDSADVQPQRELSRNHHKSKDENDNPNLLGAKMEGEGSNDPSADRDADMGEIGCEDRFRLPVLNASQRKAARSFLSAQDGSIVLVQG